MNLVEDNNCPLCRRIKQIEEGVSPHFVAELHSGYVVIGDHQLFRGYSLLLSKQHKTELHLLSSGDRSVFLEEMAIVGEAVFNAFHPVKLNYELLGNSIQHMHWHIFPRHKDDPCPNGPVWVLDRSIRYADSARPSEQELWSTKTALLARRSGLYPRAANRIGFVCTYYQFPLIVSISPIK